MTCSLVGKTQKIHLHHESLAFAIYDKEYTTERFNCNYSFNEQYRDKFQASSLQFTGTNHEGEVRIIELPGHSFFLAMLFQPQLTSTAKHPHPIVVAYLQAVSVLTQK